jgi:filamentous hemagglutinin
LDAITHYGVVTQSRTGGLRVTQWIENLHYGVGRSGSDLSGAANSVVEVQPGLVLYDSGPTTIVARNPVDLAAQHRLNQLDPDRGQFAPGEAGAAAEMEHYLGGTLVRAEGGSGADYVVTSGTFANSSIDFKLTPNSFSQADKINTYFDKTFPSFSETFSGKLADPAGPNLMVFDTRFSNPTNSQKLFDFVGNLPASSQSKVIYLGP